MRRNALVGALMAGLVVAIVTSLSLLHPPPPEKPATPPVPRAILPPSPHEPKPSPPEAASTQKEFERWIYVAATGDRPAAAVFRLQEDGLVFRVTCSRSNELRFEFHFEGNEVSRTEILDDGISLVLMHSVKDEDDDWRDMGGAFEGKVLAAHLALTPKLSHDIQTVPYLGLYAANGPTNIYMDDGSAPAFRRLARECASP